jgi:hypothetical protein
MNTQLIGSRHLKMDKVFKAHQNIRLKNFRLSFVIVLFGLLLLSTSLKAQEEKSLAHQFDISLDIKTMPLWHASGVTSGAITTTIFKTLPLAITLF